MTPYDNFRNPILVNTIGNTAGALLFGVIIVLLLRDWRIHGIRQTRLSLIAGLLALGWNIGSLIALAAADPGSLAIRIVTIASFSTLSLLPAVLLQVALQRTRRLIVAGGYIVSACAIALQFSDLFYPSIPLQQGALYSIVVGFGALTLAAFITRPRNLEKSKQRSEWISLACLALFTSSFLHFGYQHGSSPWASEIAWHHLVIPVALIVLLQDYRFLLLDTFIRFLVNAATAVVYVVSVLILNQRFGLWALTRHSMFLTGIDLAALCVSLILFASFRNAAQTWVTRVIFRRQNLDECVKAISKLASGAASEDELLSRASALVANHFRTDVCTISAVPGKHFQSETRIPIRFSSGETRTLFVGARRGGRRYLSEDLAEMRQLGSSIVEQVERFRSGELKRLATQAELRALQAQINPHFLFNAFNTLYGTIDRRSREARRLVLNLAELFRYLLQGDRAVIALSEELRIVEAYLEIESLRLGDRLQTELAATEDALSALIPVLSVQPLVENAIKHGIAPKHDGGKVSVRAQHTASGLLITVEDTGIGFERSREREQTGAGMGLENVRRRLELCYGPASQLQIESSSEGSVVRFLVPVGSQLCEAVEKIEVSA